MDKQICFLKNYFQYFYISKFLYKSQHDLFDINYIRYTTDINKISLTNMFWVFFVLFGQIPKFVKYTKQTVEKIPHGGLVVSQTKNIVYLFLRKVLNFFLLYAATEMFYIKKKNKTNINNVRLNDNHYYAELSKLPRLVFDSFNIYVYVQFKNNTKMSVFEKTQIFRVLQLPISLAWSTKMFLKKKPTKLIKKHKVNYLK